MPAFIADNLGGELGRLMEPGHMYKCGVCTLQFRSPMPSQTLLNSYYTKLQSEGVWDFDADREEWKYIKKVISNSPANSVLDIGCFRGDFLEFLGGEWEKCGVELSADASSIAAGKKIKIISDDIENLDFSGRRFGAITLIDVMEHLPQPIEALGKLSKGLVSGGMLIIATGNTRSFAFRVSGAKYYYGGYPEHVTFYSPQWFEWASPKIDCSVSSVYKFSHKRAPLRRRVDETIKNLVFIAYHRGKYLPVFGSALRISPVIKNIDSWSNPWWTSARDHMVVVLIRR
jgi:SAM-dependent methyltransferase